MSGIVKITEGDLFKSRAQTLVNSVNCVGVMGKGLALEFKKRFPDMFKDYDARCERSEVKLGYPYLYKSSIPPWIINFPTKDHWRSVSQLKDIEDGLQYLKRYYKKWGITSMAVPALGCSQGQLEWQIVGPRMYRILEEFDIPIEFYVPLNESAEEFENLISGQSSGLRVAHRESGIKPSWVALAAVLKVLEKEPYRNPVGQVMFQKIAYFATMSGLPTGLQYKRGSYGPFARGLKGIITRMVNNGLIEEHKHGRLFEVRVGTSYIVARKRFLNDLMKWRAIIEHVADLFMRVNTKQSEIMASVHMAAQDVRERTNRKPTADEVTNEVMLWKQKRRPPLSEKEVKHTVAVLAILDWIDIDAGQGWFIDEPELT